MAEKQRDDWHEIRVIRGDRPYKTPYAGTDDPEKIYEGYIPVYQSRANKGMYPEGPVKLQLVLNGEVLKEDIIVNQSKES